jgi:hypothetical protein
VQRGGPAGELAVEDQEGQSAEMVPVQVGHCDRVDRVRVESLGLERRQAGRAAVDQHHLPVAGQVDARLPPPATTERVTAASEPDPHDGILTHPAQRRNSQATISGMSAFAVRWFLHRLDAVAGRVYAGRSDLGT